MPTGETVAKVSTMKAAPIAVNIPIKIMESVDTLEELEDWLTTQNPRLMQEMRQARKEDTAGNFKAWEPKLVK